MGKNIVKEKSLVFAVEVVQLYKTLCNEKKEFVMSKQLLRSGTSIGAMLREAEHAESKADFVHKMAVAQKEANESLYWLELLKATNYIAEQEFEILYNKGTELIKLITSIIKTTKRNISNM